MRIDPWSSQQSTDYARLREEFGIAPFDYGPRLPKAPRLFRRGMIFGHRGFEPVLRAIERGEPWAVLTGLMPSGPMHLGHKLVLDQVIYYQSLGAEVFITVADIEAFATRGLALEECRRIALDEYIDNYFALGLSEERLQIYFQSERTAVKDLAWKLGRKVNWSTMESIYGFTGETNAGHIMSPLVQVGDILHVQLPEFGGPRPVVVPVGVDQDPHIRLTRDLAAAHRVYNVMMHDEPKLGRVVGIFVKPDTNVEKHIKTAQKTIEKLGYADIVVNAPYKAIYVRGVEDDVVSIDQALAVIESKTGAFGFVAPASTYHRFMQGLTGGKMSSSKPETHISLRDTPAAGRKKMSQAQTGGRATAEEQHRLGAECGKCMVYETFVYHFVDDDDELQEIYETGTTGRRLCGQCKELGQGRVTMLLDDLGARRAIARPLVDRVLARSRDAAAGAAQIRGGGAANAPGASAPNAPKAGHAGGAGHGAGAPDHHGAGSR
ncbi:MAG: tryptophan--tRNA ligase [Thermoplasmatota archaeon]